MPPCKQIPHRLSVFATILAFLLLGAISPAGAQGERSVVVTISLPTATSPPASPSEIRRWIQWLQERGYDPGRCGIFPNEATVTLTVDGEDNLKDLTDVGFRVTARTEGRPLEGGARTQSDYFDPGEIEALLMQTANDHPSVTHLFAVGTTFEGRTIYGLEISNQPGIPEDEPAILFNGQHHAREVATSHVVVDVIETLTDSYGVDNDVTDWVNRYKTVCVPMVNPDGVRYVFDFDGFWRKNRQSIPPDCIGVDLNRNYPYRWGANRCGFTSSCSSSSQTYQGPSSASELETQAMVQLAGTYQFVMATSYHAFGQFIDYPYACSNGSPDGIMPEHTVIDEMMNGMADAIDAIDSTPRYAVFSPASAGPLSGDDTSWYYAAKGVYSFIVEVGTNFEPPFSSVSGIITRNQGGWRYLYQRLGRARIDTQVTDACTGAPLEAEVTLTDFIFDTGESARVTSPAFGRWTFLVTANNTYTVRVTKAGYGSQEVSVPVQDSPATVSFSLVPDAACPPSDPAVPSSTPALLIGLFALFLLIGIVFLRRI